VHNRGLDVILVNSRSEKAPDKQDVQALAQANLNGGGNTDQDRRAATPMPPLLRNQTGEDLEQHMQRRIEELEAQQKTLMAESTRVKLKAQEKKQEAPASENMSGIDLAENAREMARLEAEIHKDREEYNKRPRKTFIGTRAQEYRFAQYIEDWRAKVERIGTLNYPAAAKGKTYGSLTLTVVLDQKGNVISVEIDKSSGHEVLDDAARRIVQLAAPYAPFPPAITRDTDLLVITRTWNFTRNDSLETR
jgi:protein TonB